MIRALIVLESPAPFTIVVLSLLIVIFSAVPSISKVVLSNLNPLSSETTVPLVNMAISSSIAFLLSPNPGALTADTFKAPLILLTTKVDSASPSTSSAIITKGLPAFAVCSNIGNKSFIAEIFLS